MKTDYTVISSYRNKEAVESLVDQLRRRGFTCYNFCDQPADPNQADAHPEEQMKVLESKQDFHEDEHFKKLFKRDLAGLKNAENVILLQPCGLSAHMEAGIAFGLGKPLIMVGEPIKPETLYLMFEERYPSVSQFLETLNVKDPTPNI